jgi:ABC-type phosphate transport system substrate-binding protein
MMKSLIFKACSVAMLLLLVFQGANAGDIVVISNSGIVISADEVRDIFLGEKQFAGDTKLVVVDNAALQAGFLVKFMHMDIAKYNGIWTKKSFRDGLTPPAVKSGDAEVFEYVKRTPGAVGYVSTATAGVKIVQ